MRVREQFSRSRSASSHFVQFFDSDDTRQESVARFLFDGYQRDSPLLIIARHHNSAAILDRLDKAGATVRVDIAGGRITVLQAADTLRRICRTGTPDPGQFVDVIGGPTSRAARHGRVYVYGEMVDLLAQRGDFADAILLEDLWNRLMTRVDLSLLCGYAAAHFVMPGTQEALRAICAAHASVHAESQDPLAAWLLDSAHTQFLP